MVKRTIQHLVVAPWSGVCSTGVLHRKHPYVQKHRELTWESDWQPKCKDGLQVLFQPEKRLFCVIACSTVFSDSALLLDQMVVRTVPIGASDLPD